MFCVRNRNTKIHTYLLSFAERKKERKKHKKGKLETNETKYLQGWVGMEQKGKES